MGTLEFFLSPRLHVSLVDSENGPLSSCCLAAVWRTPSHRHSHLVSSLLLLRMVNSLAASAAGSAASLPDGEFLAVPIESPSERRGSPSAVALLPPSPNDDSYFVVWEADNWDADRAVAAVARLALTGAPQSRTRIALFAARIGQQWNQFYQHHGINFFKDRHYLERDFPSLLAAASTTPFSLLELGCGVGNAFFPLLKRLPNLTVTAFDLSRRALTLIHTNPMCTEGCAARPVDSVAPSCPLHSRLCAFVHNAVDGGTAEAIAAARGRAGWDEVRPPPCTAPTSSSERHLPRASSSTTLFDAALLLFVASALEPTGQAAIFREAALSLRPGGELLFRDYGCYDEAELRFGAGHRLGPHLFVRSDGTMAAYFSTTQLAVYAARAGLLAVDLRYLFRVYSNRGEGSSLRRVFVHGVFRRPAPHEVTEVAFSALHAVQIAGGAGGWAP